MKDDSSPVLLAPMLVVGSMISMTLGASMAKGLMAQFGPAGTTFLRLAFSTLLLLVVWRPWRARLSLRQLKGLALYGVVLGIMNLTFYEAILRLPIGIAIAVEFMGPLTVAFVYSRSKLDVLWAVLALVGVVLILPLTQAQAKIDLVGLAYALAAGAAWAAYIVIGGKVSADSHSGMATAMGVSIAFLVTAPLGAAAAWQADWDLHLAALCVGMAVLATTIPYSLEMVALKKLSSKTFGILLSLEPALGALAAFVVLREQITWVQGVAIACVVAASLGSTMTSRRKLPATPAQ